MFIENDKCRNNPTVIRNLQLWSICCVKNILYSLKGYISYERHYIISGKYYKLYEQEHQREPRCVFT